MSEASPPPPGDMMAGIIRAVEAFSEQQRQEREAHLASPEQVAKRAATRERRSASAKRAWAKYRAEAQAAEDLQRDLEDQEESARQGGPSCEAWDSPGPPYPGEIICSLSAGHPERTHENVRYGLTTPTLDELQPGRLVYIPAGASPQRVRPLAMYLATQAQANTRQATSG
ncbi:hypothetical protein ACFLIM_25175 [Nonomuraea sp. M3C6]|uniref:Uncharacterized protein n=1 Tax=Nonomuraea marmarensis TaxID=3351344 RepID=A0ABW7AGJ3_9ACTN